MRGLNPEFVKKFADGIAGVYAEDTAAPSYGGMRLIAIAGTDIALENSRELKKAFGCSGPNKDAATALEALAYGPLDHAVYDCQIAPYATDECELAKLHMTRLKELGLGGSFYFWSAGIRPGHIPKRSSPGNKRFPVTKKSVLP